MTLKIESSVHRTYNLHFSDLKLTNHEKAILLLAVMCQGIVGERVSSSSLANMWPKGLFRVVYHPSYISECIDKGWIERSGRGFLVMTDDGSDHLENLSESKDIQYSGSTELFVFPPKKAQNFDEMIRKALAGSTLKVRIADSYVDETIFDIFLSSIPDDIAIELMYNHSTGIPYDARESRFRIQYPKFKSGKYTKLHDRYLIIDDIGYMIGPSLKDAAVKSPATVVRLDVIETKKLLLHFDNIFANITKK